MKRYQLVHPQPWSPTNVSGLAEDPKGKFVKYQDVVRLMNTADMIVAYLRGAVGDESLTVYRKSMELCDIYERARG